MKIHKMIGNLLKKQKIIQKNKKHNQMINNHLIKLDLLAIMKNHQKKNQIKLLNQNF